jgi:hypothetical protein
MIKISKNVMLNSFQHLIKSMGSRNKFGMTKYCFCNSLFHGNRHESWPTNEYESIFIPPLAKGDEGGFKKQMVAAIIHKISLYPSFPKRGIFRSITAGALLDNK